MPSRLLEDHRTNRVGWLRAAVLGANDGLLSTGQLGDRCCFSPRNARQRSCSRSGWPYGRSDVYGGWRVCLRSVHSQADTENADLELEKMELKADWEGEHQELAAIYVARGLEPQLANQVAQRLMSKMH
jgi:vacuolar iron transporter family protein